jgi:hypothetical protein
MRGHQPCKRDLDMNIPRLAQKVIFPYATVTSFILLQMKNLYYCVKNVRAL